MAWTGKDEVLDYLESEFKRLDNSEPVRLIIIALRAPDTKQYKWSDGMGWVGIAENDNEAGPVLIERAIQYIEENFSDDDPEPQREAIKIWRGIAPKISMDASVTESPKVFHLINKIGGHETESETGFAEKTEHRLHNTYQKMTGFGGDMGYDAMGRAFARMAATVIELSKGYVHLVGTVNESQQKQFEHNAKMAQLAAEMIGGAPALEIKRLEMQERMQIAREEQKAQVQGIALQTGLPLVAAMMEKMGVKIPGLPALNESAEESGDDPVDAVYSDDI